MKPKHPVFWPLVGLAALVLLNAIHDVGFLKVTLLDGHLYGVPVDILSQGSRTMLVALGMTLVIATGGVDLSVGSVVAISGAVCAVLLRDGHSLAVTLAAAIGTGLLAGSANGLLVARLGVQPIVATLILMVSGRGVAQLIVDGNVIPIKSDGFSYLANGYLFGVPFAVLLVGVLYVAAQLALRRTALGLFIEGVGDNETASRFAGLAAARIKALAYIFCGACAGLVGILAAANIRAADAYRAGENMELDAIFAVVVGGTALTGGRFIILGTAVGALLIQTLTTTMYHLGVSPDIALMPKALVIVVVAILQSEKAGRWLAGLWSKKEAA
ncbi:MAG TPA: ABC transporter permease [Lacunisphaera sp.]|nr:ABC transporter permease [Lacunisphaera sp.]